MGSDDKTPLIPNPGTRWRWVACTPRPLYDRRKNRYPLNRRIDEPQCRSWQIFKREKSVAPAGNRTTIPLSPSP